MGVFRESMYSKIHSLNFTGVSLMYKMKVESENICMDQATVMEKGGFFTTIG